jgi:AP-2 complex subunit alpha
LEIQSALLKKAEDAEVDSAEQSAIKLRAQQQMSNALVVTDQRPANGAPQIVGELSLVKIPSMSDDVGSSCLLFMNPSFSLEECINDF